MISNRELKAEIEQLTEQHQSLSEDLQQIKALLQQQSQNQNQNQNQNRNQSRNRNQDQNQGQDGGAGGDNSRQQKHGGGNTSSDDGNGISGIAEDFLRFKSLTEQLEMKMQGYVSQNSNNGSSLTQEDVINLILNMMNGMIDWTIDYVTSQQANQQSGASSSQQGPSSQYIN